MPRPGAVARAAGRSATPSSSPRSPRRGVPRVLLAAVVAHARARGYRRLMLAPPDRGERRVLPACRVPARRRRAAGAGAVDLLQPLPGAGQVEPAAVQPGGELRHVRLAAPQQRQRRLGDRPVPAAVARPARRARRARRLGRLDAQRVPTEPGRRRCGRRWSRSAVALPPVAERGRGVGDREPADPGEACRSRTPSPSSVRTCASSPSGQRRRAGRRGGHERAQRGEQPTDEPARRPGEQPDPAARTADPQQLGRRPLVERGEHHATQDSTTSNAASGKGSAWASAAEVGNDGRGGVLLPSGWSPREDRRGPCARPCAHPS